MDTRICKKCLVEKPLEEFAKSVAYPQGRRYVCTICKNARSVADRLASNGGYAARDKASAARRKAKDPEAYLEKGRRQTAKSTAAHPERVRARQKKNRIDHPEKSRANDAKYYAKYREKRLAKWAAKYAADPEPILTHQQEYRQAHPEIGRASAQKRRARKRGAPINDLTGPQFEEIKVAFNYRCAYCPPTCWRCKKKKHTLTQDHITALSKDGSHTVHNVVPACLSCNSKKGDKPAPLHVQPLLLTVAPSKKKKAA